MLGLASALLLKTCLHLLNFYLGRIKNRIMERKYTLNSHSRRKLGIAKFIIHVYYKSCIIPGVK
jgi:hypothetical protein